MQSQKTFANHLDDYLALQALTEANSTTNKRSGPKKKDAASSSTLKTIASKDLPSSLNTKDLPPILPPSFQQEAPTPLPGDDDILLMSRVPEVPTDKELRNLLAQPPLPYLEALGHVDETYPKRAFCEVCGYWGRVRCVKCGTRVCALECLETHREECVTRYGV